MHNNELILVLESVAFELNSFVKEIRNEFEWRRSHERLATRHDLMAMENHIMATQKEIADGLNAANAQLTKIGAETDTLLQKIKDLETAVTNQADASPELVAAFEAVKAQVQVVDDKVPGPTL